MYVILNVQKTFHILTKIAQNKEIDLQSYLIKVHTQTLNNV